jgi:hypothetical protein
MPSIALSIDVVPRFLDNQRIKSGELGERESRGFRCTFASANPSPLDFEFLTSHLASKSLPKFGDNSMAMVGGNPFIGLAGKGGGPMSQCVFNILWRERPYFHLRLPSHPTVDEDIWSVGDLQRDGSEE